MNHNKSNTLVTALMGLVMGSTTHAACTVATATPFQAGPPNPNNGFAEYLRDSTGLELELCLSPSTATIDPVTQAVISPVGTPPFCLFDPPDPANAFSSQIGFGAEGFWWLAAPDTTNFPAGVNAVLVLAAEAAFGGEVPIDGDQFTFTRLRIRLDLSAVGYYRVTEPYGVHVFEVPALVAGNEVNESYDIEFAQGTIGGDGTVTEATNDTNCVGPWLTWDTYPIDTSTGDVDPLLDNSGNGVADFIGDGTTSHAVIGSTITTTDATGATIPANLFRIEAFTDAALTDPMPINGDSNTVETNLFTVVGKVYDGVRATQLVAERTTYTRDASGATGQVDIFARGAGTASVSFSGDANVTGAVLSQDNQGNFFESELLAPDATQVPAVVVLDATDSVFDPTQLVSPLVDLVTISLAEYDLGVNPPTLTVNAASSDNRAPPVLTVVELNQPLTAGSIALTEASPGVALSPPGAITVASSAGGSATRLVEVVNSDLDGDGVPNDADNCPLTANPLQENDDADGIGNACDNCTAVANADQRDTDADGFGNMCDADLNNDNVVNLSDFSRFRADFGKTAPLSPEDEHADFNGDGSINLSDFSIFRASFGGAPGPSGLNP